MSGDEHAPLAVGGSGAEAGARTHTPASGSVHQALEAKAAAELGAGEAAPASLLDRAEGIVVGGLALAALAMCSYNVLVRWLQPSLTLEFSDEVQVYLMIWAVFLGLGLVTAADRHVRADLFLAMFPAPLRRLALLLGEVLGLAFSLLMLWFGVMVAYDSWSFGDVSTTTLRFPMWIFFAALPAGALVMGLAYARRLLRMLRTPVSG